MVELTDEEKAKQVVMRLRGADPKHCGIVELCCGDVGSVTLILHVAEDFNHSQGDLVMFPSGVVGVLSARTEKYFHIRSVSGQSDLRVSQGEYVVFFSSELRQI